MIFGIVCKEDNVEALALSGRVLEWTQQHGFTCLIEDHIADFIGCDHTDNILNNSNLLIAIGGDGTILRTIRMSAHQAIPILGVHMGYLGFLTEVLENEVYDALDAVIRGDYINDERTMFKATIVRDGKTISSQHIINDVVINKSALARIIDIEVWTNSTFITCYRADGLIVSTPTGSTAYNLATGGPIVHPHVDAIILTPICPHVLSNRSIVLPDFQEVVIVVNSGKAADDIYLTLDGQRGFPLKAGDTLVVKRGEFKAIMLRFPQRDYFEILRTKLGWQER